MDPLLHLLHHLAKKPSPLEPFIAVDCPFFLELLPSPAGDKGLSAIFAFLKQRIECGDVLSFPVGIIYGPATWVTTSRIKDRLAHLSELILSVYIEATPNNTAARLLQELQQRFPDLTGAGDLAGAIALLREGKGLRAGQKVLLVLDQFERWLHAPHGQEDSELAQALRQCDGQRVQALVIGQRMETTPGQGLPKPAGFPVIRGLAFSLLLVAAILAALSIHGRNLERQRLAQARELVSRLLDADIAQVPSVLAEMAVLRPRIDPLLQEAYAEAEGQNDSGKQLRASLALLPDDPGQLPYLCGRLLDAQPQELPALRDALRDHKTELRERLWAAVEQTGRGHDRQRLRAAFALAAYDPQDPRWARIAGPLADQLVAGPPIFLPTLMEGLRPISSQLIGPLAVIFRDRREGRALERALATDFLADYAAEQPRVLADLLMEADDRQFAVLFPKLKGLGNQAWQLLASELSRQLKPSWNDVPLNPSWQEPDSALKQQIEAANGILAERFAFIQTMPLEQSLALTDQLRKYAYRPIRFRPYRGGKDILVSAVWTRDGLDWQQAQGLTAEQHSQADQVFRDQGYVAVDVAGYLATEAGALRVRYAGLWMKAAVGETRRVYLAPEVNQRALQDQLTKEGFLPLTFQALTSLQGRPLYSSVWRQGIGLFDLSCSMSKQEFLSRNPDRLGLDVAGAGRIDRGQQIGPELLGWFSGAGGTQWGGCPWMGLGYCQQSLGLMGTDSWYCGVWHVQPTMQDARLAGLDVGAHLARCRDLMAQGFRPAAISVTEAGPDNLLEAASIWHLPEVPEEAKEALAKRQANAAVALLKIGQAQPVWPLLKQTPDPRLRSYLIHRLASLGADPGALVQRLDEEKEPSIRQALLLCLGEFEPGQLSPATGNLLIPKVVQMYRDEPDPGIHGAARWLLRQWQESQRLDEIDGQWTSDQPRREVRLDHIQKELARGPGQAEPQWFVNGQGQTMVVIPGPVEFLMGSPQTEDGRDGGPGGELEKHHRKRIGRPFAIANREVTVSQYHQFRPDQVYNRRYAPTGDCPANDVSWYDAAAYCNWLSKQEGIGEDQWCYLPNSAGEFAEGMKPAPNFLQRHGYRLPSEAEWEAACRGGTQTSRFHGATEDLLGQYAWYTRNSQDRVLLPAGSLKPNDLGLFDILGNAVEWCHDPFLPYTADLDDKEEEGEIKNNQFRVLRGGSYYARAAYVRSASRNWNLPGARGDDVGFRPARTLR